MAFSALLIPVASDCIWAACGDCPDCEEVSDCAVVPDCVVVPDCSAKAEVVSARTSTSDVHTKKGGRPSLRTTPAELGMPFTSAMKRRDVGFTMRTRATFKSVFCKARATGRPGREG